MIGSAILHLAAEIDSEIRESFDRWSDAHSRTDLAHPGFLGVRRFERSLDWAGQGASMPCLTIYELEDLSALTSRPYLEHDQSMPAEFRDHLRYRRSVFQEVERFAGGGELARRSPIFHVLTEVEAGHEAAFERWYAGVHMPAVMTAPGILGARRFVRVEDPAGKAAPGARYACLAIYEMADAGVVARKETVDAANTAICPTDLDLHRSVVHHVYEPVFLALASG